MRTVFSGEEWLPAENLGKDAPHRPDVNCQGKHRWKMNTLVSMHSDIATLSELRRTSFGVVLPRKHNLGRAVPPRRHVLGQERVVVGSVGNDAGQTEIADLHERST